MSFPPVFFFCRDGAALIILFGFDKALSLCFAVPFFFFLSSVNLISTVLILDWLLCLGSATVAF